MSGTGLKNTKKSGRSIQLQELLQYRIESGQYGPGKKIDSVRTLAAEFHVGKETVQKVLRELEMRGFVCSIPGKGVYVNHDFAHEKKTVKLAFVIPAAEISPDSFASESQGILSGIRRGIMLGGERYGAKIDFIHVPENSRLTKSSTMVKNLSKYDGLLFIGGRLRSLKQLLCRTVPLFSYDDKFEYEGHHFSVFYDRSCAYELLAEHIRKCGCRTVGIYSFAAPENPEAGNSNQFLLQRAEMFRDVFVKSGLIVRDEDIVVLPEDETLKDILFRQLSGTRPDFIFCNNVYLVPEVYRVCMKHRLLIGNEVRIGGQGTGYTFQGIVPSLTYIKVPVFEAGQRLVELACEYVNGGGQLNMDGRCRLPVELELNESTSGCL